MESEHPKTRAIIHEVCEKRSDNDSSEAASEHRNEARELRAVVLPGPTTLCVSVDKEARLEDWLSKLPDRGNSYISDAQEVQDAQTKRQDQWKKELEDTEGSPRYEWIDDRSYTTGSHV